MYQYLGAKNLWKKCNNEPDVLAYQFDRLLIFNGQTIYFYIMCVKVVGSNRLDGRKPSSSQSGLFKRHLEVEIVTIPTI